MIRYAPICIVNVYCDAPFWIDANFSEINKVNLFKGLKLTRNFLSTISKNSLRVNYFCTKHSADVLDKNSFPNVFICKLVVIS